MSNPDKEVSTPTPGRSAPASWTVYLAGEPTGIPYGRRDLYDAAAQILKDAGHQVITPDDLDQETPLPDTQPSGKGVNDRISLGHKREILAVLQRCDAVLIVRGGLYYWAAQPVRYAAAHSGISIYADIDELLEAARAIGGGE